MIKTTGFDDELEKISGLARVLDEELTKELNDFGLAWRDDVRANTNVVTGDLRRSTIFEGTEKNGSEFIVAVSNNLEYAEHYEYGHRQTPGRFVPAIGKRLVAKHVRGRYTFRNAKRCAKEKVHAALKRAMTAAERRMGD